MTTAAQLGIIPTDEDRAAREQRLAEMVTKLRDKCPNLDDGYWDGLAERARLEWRISDLNQAVWFLVGYYGERAERTGNTDLSEMVDTLKDAADAIQEQSHG